MKQEITVHLYMEHQWNATYTAKDHWGPVLWPHRPEETDERIYVGPRTVTVDVPENFNPIPQQVAALEREKAAALKAYQNSVADINERLSKLLAITNDAEAA